MSHHTFKMIPDEEELAGLHRDLRFFTAETVQPKVLTKHQISEFNRNGFLRSIRVFDYGEITDIRSYFEDLLKRVLAAGGDSYSISTAHLQYGRVWDLLMDERIVNPVADLLGENVVGWGSHFFCKMPKDGKTVAWHQDAGYWPLTPSKTVTVWLAIDDADVENACMRFIAGSHHHGLIDWKPSARVERNVLNQTIANAEQYGEVVDNILRAGEMSLHTDLLLHGSQANDSDKRRCGLTLRYCAVDVRAHLHWNQKGVVVKGVDESGHWANPARPEVDFPD